MASAVVTLATMPHDGRMVTRENVESQAGGPRHHSAMMMPEQPMPVPEEIPDNLDIQREHEEHREDGILHQFMDFNRDEERGLANGQPTGPTYAKDQSHAFHQRKEAVAQCPGRRTKHFRLGKLADL